MKRTLLFLMAVLFAAIGNVQTTFAQKASLNAADGWTQITSLPDNPSQYFFAIYDHEQDLGMVFKNGDHQGNGNWTMWYTADVNPMDNEAALWMIGNNDEYQVIANFTKPQTMLQTEWNAAWFCHATDNGGGGTNWGHTKFTYLSDGYWTIQNGQYPDAGYVGPWSDVKQDNAEIAANKQGDAVGHFDIFAITRQQYWINRVNAGLTYPFDMTNAIANTDAILQPNQGWTETYTEPRSNGYTFQKQGNDGLPNKVAQVFFESWQGSGNLSDRQMQQTLANMPVGNYKLTVNTDATATGAFLYAGSNEIDLSQKVDGVASLDFKVSSDNQDLNLGIKLVSHLSNWVKFDHFQLTYYRLPINMEAVELPTNGDMVADQWYYIDILSEGDYSAIANTLANIVYTTDGELQIDDTSITTQFEAAGNSMSATRYYIKSSSDNNFKIETTNFDYTLATGKMNAEVEAAQTAAETAFTNNPTYETYQALLSAIQTAEASVAEYQKIAARLALLAAQTGDIPQAEFESATVYTNYENGVYTSLDEVVPAYKADVANYWATNAPADGADLTAFIVNQGFEFGDLTGWTLPQGESGGAGSKAITNGDHGPQSASEGVYYYSSWWTGKPVQQVLGDLPNGTYRLSAKFATNDTGDEHTVYLYANDRNIATTHEANTFGTWKDAESLVFIVTDGTATIGAVGGKQDNSFDVNNPWIFFNADNFRLTYVSSGIDVDVVLPTGQMNVDVKAAMNAANEAYLASKTLDNYNALLAAVESANASIALYQQINDRLAKLTSHSQLGSIDEADAKAMAFYTKYSDGSLEGTGTYTSLDEVIPEYRANVAAYYATNAPDDGDDLSAFIVNNTLDFGNAAGWSGGGGVNHGNIEWYNGNYNVFQTLVGLPAGTYHLQAQGYYRPGGNGNASTDKNAMLYAGSFTAPVVLIASDGKSAADADNGFTTANTNSGSEVFVPNSQADAEKVFGIGAYYNEVEFVSTGADINVGFKKDVFIQNDWTCFDNFKLIYMGPEATIAPELVNAPMNADINTAQQTAYDTWEANKSMDNYNALIAAIEAAQASADKYVIINERIPKLAAQSGGIEVTPTLTEKYDNGEYVEADDVFAAYHDIVKEALANPADGTDMTPFIINPSFEFANGDGWEYNTSGDTGIKQLPNDTYNMSNSDGSYLFNTWSGNGAENLHIAQLLTDLKAGTYELTATFATYNDYTVNFTAGNIHGETTDEEKLSFMPKDIDGTYGPETGLVKTIRFYVSDGTLMIGANANGFFKVDNFQLKYISNTIDLVDTNQPMNQYERGYYLDALDAYNADPSSENLHQLLKYKLIAENSINAYKAARATFDRVISMMSKTNVYTFDAYFTIDDMYRKYGPEEGYYRYETLEDDVAYDLERMFFGAGHYRNYVDPFSNPPDLTWMGDIPAVPFIASAWDCGFDGYAYRYKEELELPSGGHWKEGDDYYANTWSTEGIDDGTNMLNPYLEYWLYGDQLLAPKTMTATVDGTPGKEYTVKMFVRVRTIEDNQQPQGMSIQIGDGTPVVPNWQYVDNSSSYYVLNNMYRLWVCNLWDYAEADLPKGYVDQDGKLRIKFIMEPGETNITWLSFKDVYVNYDGEDLTQALADLQTEVNYAKTNFVNYLGFDPEEYAPYTNVDELIAYKRAEQVHDASENYFLVKAAHDKLYEYNHGGENGEGTWTKNPYEMNGFYWTDYWNNNEPDKYTAEDVQHVEWYDYEDDCITPSGWNLIGRNDGFNTGIVKLGVNSDGEGLKSAESEIALRAKYETDYGQETGYTLPLKKGVKYIMTFTYAYEGDNPSGCPFETRISLSAPRTGVSNVLDEPLTVTEIQPILRSGGENQANWYMYRATFVPHFDADYVITFDKDNVDPEPVLYGDLTLVRYYEGDANPETSDENVYVINGESRTYGETLEEPKFVGKNVRITRSFNPGAYNSLVLPFKLAECELKEALGENWNGKVYYYTGATPTDTEGGDFYTLNFEERETGIFANVPVLFFNDADAPVNNWAEKIFNKMVTKRVENELTIDTDVFDFIGTYETIKLPNGAWYINAANQFMKAMGKSSLSPTRGYFLPRDANGEQILQAKLVGFSIDNVPTGIIAIEDDGTFNVTSGNIYTIDGRLVRQNATSLEGLAPGTYIVDGKKYIIK